ncbi:hypothetical protein [Lacrimispora sp.]|uniref:hypothetical protein n=1 Tax=Lacrimispora sp. TaxID=2719234 RepID=UPI003996AE09
MNKEKYNKVVEIIVKILVVIAIINGVIVGGSIIFFIVLFLKGFSTTPKVTEEEVKLEQEQRLEAVKSHLENKYGEKFIVNPNGKRNTGSFIPGAVNTSPDYYEAYSEEDPEFIFRVYKYSESHNIDSEEEIKDSYCWKFLKEKLKKTIESALPNEFPEEYKIFIDTYSDITFDNSIRQDSQLEKYFNGNYASPIIFINVYALDSKEKYEKNIEQKISLLFEEFKSKYNNMNMNFSYYSVENEKNFSRIDTKELEKKSLIIYGDNYPELFSEIKMERKFVVKIDTKN